MLEFLEKISPKLIDQNVVVEKERKILFETRSKTNQKCNSIAYLAANILYYSIKITYASTISRRIYIICIQLFRL